ncbi:MAG: hypothetical protein ACLRY8_04220 [Clostridium butyricum]|nr:hypothetical protein [Clostridium butyricum]MDI9210512.1 hypothetical protein [Clostridium butyricum]
MQKTINKNDIDIAPIKKKENLQLQFEDKISFDIFYHSTVEQKKSLLHSLIETISINNGETTKERTINKIKLYFEPVDVQAQNLTKKFATTYDTVLRITFK